MEENKVDTFEDDYTKFINEETRQEVKHLFKISFKKLIEEYPESFERLRPKTGFKIKEGKEDEAKEILKNYYIPPYKFKIYTAKYINKAGEVKEYQTFKPSQKKNLIFDDLGKEEFVKEIVNKDIRNAYKSNEIYDYIQFNDLNKYKNLTKKQVLNFVNRRFSK